MRCVAKTGLEDIQTAVKVADPKLVTAINSQRRDVAIGQHGIGRREHAPPSSALTFFLIERIPRDHIERATLSKNLLHVRHGARGRMQNSAHTFWLRIDLKNAVAISARQQRCAVYIHSSGEGTRGQNAKESSTLKFRNANRRADISFVTGQSDRKDLSVRQALCFSESFGTSSLPVHNSLILRSDPQIRFAAGQFRYM